MLGEVPSVNDVRSNIDEGRLPVRLRNEVVVPIFFS